MALAFWLTVTVNSGGGAIRVYLLTSKAETSTGSVSVLMRPTREYCSKPSINASSRWTRPRGIHLMPVSSFRGVSLMSSSIHSEISAATALSNHVTPHKQIDRVPLVALF